MIKDAIGFSSLLSPLHFPQICCFTSNVGCFLCSAVAWAVPKQYWSAFEKIIGFSLKQFYADAIELVCSVKVRAILGSIQMRTGQYTLRQMSKPISSFNITRVCVSVCGTDVCVLSSESLDLILGSATKKASRVLNIMWLQTDIKTT